MFDNEAATETTTATQRPTMPRTLNSTKLQPAQMDPRFSEALQRVANGFMFHWQAIVNCCALNIF